MLANTSYGKFDSLKTTTYATRASQTVDESVCYLELAKKVRSEVETIPLHRALKSLEIISQTLCR